MANVFSGSPEEDDDQAPGLRVAGALTGGDEEEEEPQQAAQLAPPRGVVDESAQSYLTPAGADEDQQEPEPQQAGSADTQAYINPIPPPTLAKPNAFADHSDTQARMIAQKKTESQENTKPSVWRRIGAGLAAGAVGFGTRNAEEGMRVGQAITDAPLVNAQHRWAMQEAPIQAQQAADQSADAAVTRGNANIEQQNKLAETNYRNQSLGQQNAARAADYAAQAKQRANAITAFTPDDPANPYAGGTGTTADGRTVKGVPPPDKWLANWEKNPDNVANSKAQAGVKTLKALEAAGVKLTPEQRAIVASGGKVTPSVRTTVSIRENPDGSAVTPAGNSKDTVTPAGWQNLLNQRDREYRTWQTSKDAELALAPDDQAKGAIEAKYAGQSNDLQDRWNQRLAQADPQGKYAPKPAPSAAPQQRQQTPVAQTQQPVYKAKSGATVTVGTPVVVNGRKGVVDSFDKNGKPVVKY
jgi:hypothetical protein